MVLLLDIFRMRKKCGYDSYSVDAPLVCCKEDYYSVYTYLVRGLYHLDKMCFVEINLIEHLSEKPMKFVNVSLVSKESAIEKRKRVGQVNFFYKYHKRNSTSLNQTKKQNQ